MGTKVLIFGLGSIGCRHAEVLLESGSCEVAACRTGKGYKEIAPALGDHITMFSDAEAAFAWGPDFLIVSNPTAMHPAYAAAALDRGIDVLIEKPVGASVRDVEGLEIMVAEHGLRAYVGYNLRFHPIIESVRHAIDSQAYGRVLKADLYAGHWLPHWHPYEDYRRGYAARKDLGGGVLRTLSHELDLGKHLFGNYFDVAARVSRTGTLEIDSDDSVEVIAEMQRCPILRISLDYLRPTHRRGGEVFLEGGLITYDFGKMSVELAGYDRPESQPLLHAKGPDPNRSYRRQMEMFLSGGGDPLCTLKEGIEVMRVIEACERSNEERKVINVQAG